MLAPRTPMRKLTSGPFGISMFNCCLGKEGWEDGGGAVDFGIIPDAMPFWYSNTFAWISAEHRKRAASSPPEMVTVRTRLPTGISVGLAIEMCVPVSCCRVVMATPFAPMMWLTSGPLGISIVVGGPLSPAGGPPGCNPMPPSAPVLPGGPTLPPATRYSSALACIIAAHCAHDSSGPEMVTCRTLTPGATSLARWMAICVPVNCWRPFTLAPPLPMM
mmetsp:Transcript_69034/g.136837  ORF Transcript_69034/g.136837 Transcript_69034/m.136837 type:complete len:218 (+) Transcript_69034:313-966(+)